MIKRVGNTTLFHEQWREHSYMFPLLEAIFRLLEAEMCGF